MASPLTTDEVDAIKAGHAAGKSCRAIAKDLGRSASVVARYARELGLAFDGTKTAQATKAKQADNSAKRAALEARFLDEAALLLDQLHVTHLVYNFGGKDNTYEEHTLSEPDIGGKRSLIQAAGTAVDKAMKLADADRDTTGAQAGRSMIGGLFALLHGTAPEDPDATEAPDETNPPQE